MGRPNPFRATESSGVNEELTTRKIGNHSRLIYILLNILTVRGCGLCFSINYRQSLICGVDRVVFTP